MKKHKSPKKRKLVITFSDRDYRRLSRYALNCGIRKSDAVKRLMREGLKHVEVEKKEVDVSNQLSMFDSLQMEIFDIIDKEL